MRIALVFFSLGLPGSSGIQRKVFSKKKLPILNWAPVTNTAKTIFEVCLDF